MNDRQKICFGAAAVLLCRILQFVLVCIFCKYMIRCYGVRQFGYFCIFLDICLMLMLFAVCLLSGRKELFLSGAPVYIFYGVMALLLSVCEGVEYAAYLSAYLLIMWFVYHLVKQASAYVYRVFENIQSTFEKYFYINILIGAFCVACFWFFIQPFIQQIWGNIYILGNSTVLLLSIDLLLAIMVQLLERGTALWTVSGCGGFLLTGSAALEVVLSVSLCGRLGIDGILIGLAASLVLYFGMSFFIRMRYVCLSSYWHFAIKAGCIVLSAAFAAGCANELYDRGNPVEYGNKSRERRAIYPKEGIYSKEKEFHLSFDDVIDIFIDLTENEKKYDSIFENEDLGWMKKLHDRYGALISCYVFYQWDGFSLDQCTAKFRNEFEENSDWLRFGFHAWEPGTVYGKQDASELVGDYSQTVKCLKKIVGGGITHVIRLHYYAGSREEIMGLMAHDTEPITGLLSADDMRPSYYLSEEDSRYIYCHDEFADPETGMRFISTDIRVEFVKQMDHKCKEFAADSWNNQLEDLVVFTHEWALDDDVKEKTEDVCAYAAANNYTFTFFENIRESGFN